MTLRTLLEQVQVLSHVGDTALLDSPVTALVTQAALARHGTAFIATRTVLRDNHFAAAAAYTAGCRLFVAEHSLSLAPDALVLTVADCAEAAAQMAAAFYGYPARELTLFGVLGAAGKSSVAMAVTEVLCAAGVPAVALLTDGIFTPNTYLPHGNTVPDGVDIQRILREQRDRGAAYAVIEISAHMLRYQSFAALPLAALLLTDSEGNGEVPEELCRLTEKRRIPYLLLPTSCRDKAPDGARFYGAGGEIEALCPTPLSDKQGIGTRFTLSLNGQKETVSLYIPGDMAVSNALAAALLAAVADLPLSDIAKGLTRARVPGTLTPVALVAGRRIYRDVAYSPEALGRALSTLRAVTEGKLTVLVGSVGGRAVARRAPLGRTAGALADLVYFTADNPDDEDPLSICREMACGVEDPSRYVIVPDRAAAIRRAVLEMRPGDTLLVAGKGRESYQLIAGKRTPFDEEELIKEAARML